MHRSAGMLGLLNEARPSSGTPPQSATAPGRERLLQAKQILHRSTVALPAQVGGLHGGEGPSGALLWS